MPKSADSKRSDSPRSKGSQLRAQLRLLLDDEIALGPGKADLLDAIRDTGSISAAGKRMGMSYRRAWLLVDSMNRCFRDPLVATATGGSQGGGAQVTAHGEEVLQHYRALQRAVANVTAQHAKALEALLRKTPLPAAH